MAFEDYYRLPGPFNFGQKQKQLTLGSTVNAGSVCPTCGTPLNTAGSGGVPSSVLNSPFVFTDNWGVQPNGTDVFPG